ncbi:hypothetical protein QQF64_023708 [Cirrhinus molitorella]|uniref:Uncharacterized protein n=1 Tax=Cirrhinus molitorella TaxID=172907 RepID=A0ABR3NJ57_9TELE
MVAGLMERYCQAAVPPPVLLHVDCGCCVSDGATSKLQTRFGSVGCWRPQPVVVDKGKQLMQECVPAITDILVDRSTIKKGAEPLLPQEDTRNIQDMPGVPLYTEVGTFTKAGVTLIRYRYARGSTSLESFQCHLNRFIPGGGTATAILAQEHGGIYRPVVYLSKTLDAVARGPPACLCAVAATAIMVQDAEHIVLSHPMMAHTSHQGEFEVRDHNCLARIHTSTACRPDVSASVLEEGKHCTVTIKIGTSPTPLYCQSLFGHLPRICTTSGQCTVS